MIFPRQLSNRRHRTFSDGEAFRGGQRSVGSFGLSADSVSVVQRQVVEATRERRKKKGGGGRERKKDRREGKTETKGRWFPSPKFAWRWILADTSLRLINKGKEKENGS